MIKSKFEGREVVMQRLRKLLPDAEAGIEQAKADATNELARAIRARAPRGKTGKYADSIIAAKIAGRNQPGTAVVTTSRDPNAWGVFADFIWRFLEFGTQPGVRGQRVTNRGAGIKQNKGAGRLSYRTHPGTKARPHIFPTYRAMRKSIRRKIAGAMNKAVRTAKKGR